MTIAEGGRGGAGVRNHWYVDDQFQRQLESPLTGDVIRGRWRVFGEALRAHAGCGSGVLRVLDAGCGDGVNLVGLRRILSELERPWELTALDLSAVRIGRARVAERAAGRILQGSVSALPLAATSVDVVLCNHVLEHVPEPSQAAVELARVLKPGGLAIIGVPNEGCALARVRNHLFQRSILRTTDHVNFFTRETVTRLLTGAGLTPQAVYTEGFFVPHLRLQAWIRSMTGGPSALEFLRRRLPNQAAGLIVIANRAPDSAGALPA